jgi:hypothetical protein
VRAEVLQAVARPRGQLRVLQLRELDALADFEQRLAQLQTLVEIIRDEDDGRGLDGARDVTHERLLVRLKQRRTRVLPDETCHEHDAATTHHRHLLGRGNRVLHVRRNEVE